MKKKKKHKLSLIEILAIIVVIIVLLVLLLSNLETHRNKPKINQIQGQVFEIAKKYNYSMSCTNKENNVWNIKTSCVAYKDSGQDNWIHFYIDIFEEESQLEYYYESNRNELEIEERIGEKEEIILVSESGGIITKKLKKEKLVITLSTGEKDNVEEIDSILKEITRIE